MTAYVRQRAFLREEQTRRRMELASVSARLFVSPTFRTVAQGDGGGSSTGSELLPNTSVLQRMAALDPAPSSQEFVSCSFCNKLFSAQRYLTVHNKGYNNHKGCNAETQKGKQKMSSQKRVFDCLADDATLHIKDMEMLKEGSTRKAAPKTLKDRASFRYLRGWKKEENRFLLALLKITMPFNWTI